MKPQSSTVSELVKAFDGYLSMRRSAGTRAKYGQHLAAFEEWAEGRTIDSIEAQEIEFEFLGPWAQTVSSATLRNRISAMRSFYDFCERFDHVERNVMRKIEPPARDDRMGNWLKADDDVAYQDAVVDPAERIIVTLLRHTGLRVSEATALLWSDIDLKSGTLSVRKSKTSAGKRTIPLAPVLVPALRTWQRHLETRGLYDRNGYVLVTKNRTPMKAQFVWKLTTRVGDRLGLDVSPHTLRRTCGSALINNGARLEVVSKFLGHSSTKITEQSYAELLDATVAAEALEAMAYSHSQVVAISSGPASANVTMKACGRRRTPRGRGGRYERRVITNRPKFVSPAPPHATTTPRRFQSRVGAKHGSNQPLE